MAKRNKEVFEIMAGIKVPVIAGYDKDSAIPDKSYIGYHKCEECNSSVVVNCLDAPACPICAGTLNNISDDSTVALSSEDFSKLKTLCSCETCGTTWAGKEDTLASLVDHSIYCPACTTPMVVKAENDSSDDSNTDDKSKTETDDSSNKMADKTDDSSDATDADKELDEALKKLNLKNSDDSDKNTKSDKSEESSASDDDEEDGDNEDEDDDEEADASDLVFAMALKDAKDISVIASKNFGNWYMFNGKTPIAVADFDKAEASVQTIFRSNEYITALENAINNDGGVNKELMKDFGFEPVKVDLKIDDLSKKIIEEEVANKTKQTEDKLASLSEYYEQAVGIAAVGITKGLYDKGDDFRNTLVATLVSNNVRDPEHIVDDFLAKKLPDLMKNTISLAGELMEKSPEALAEVAAMVVSSKSRTVSFQTKKTQAKTPAIAIHSNEDDNDSSNENTEKHNLRREKATASDIDAAHKVSGLFKTVKTRVNV